jgi:hypothetical protein
MDPYIESQGGWRGFLLDFIVRCKWQLNEHLPSQYAAIAGERVEVQEPLPPNIEMLDLPKQVYVEIIHLPGQEVVTDIEMLSPGNKRPGSRDRAAYLTRRRNLLDHSVNVVELNPDISSDL